MANWDILKRAISEVIKTNGNQEITGAALQSTLNTIVSNLGENATFKGVATPATTPGTPDGPLFYIAYEKGIYANFNAINLTEEDGLVIILYSSNWNKINIPLALKDELVQVRSDLSETTDKLSELEVKLSNEYISEVYATNEWHYTSFTMKKDRVYVVNVLSGQVYACIIQDSSVQHDVRATAGQSFEVTADKDGSFGIYSFGSTQFSVVDKASLINNINTLNNDVESLKSATQSISTVIPVKANLEAISNIFDASNMADVINGYITPNGGLSVERDCYVSSVIEIKPNVKYRFYSGNGGKGAVLFRLLNSSLEKVKPLQIDGTEFGDYGMSIINNTDTKYREFLTPSNAKYIQFTTTFDGVHYKEGISVYELEKGTGYLPYEVKLKESEIPSIVALKSDTQSGDYNGVVHIGLGINEMSYIESNFTDTKNIRQYFKLQRKGATLLDNQCFNFESTFLVDKVTGAETKVHDTTDDICPAKYNKGTYNVGYIGAGHAAQCVNRCVCGNHGKTNVDVGSIWNDGTHDYTLVAINEDWLYFVSENLATYPIWDFAKMSVGTLTHKSGATHTNLISVSSVNGLEQWWSAFKPSKVHIFVDGKEIKENGDYKFNEVKVTEEYDVINPVSVINKMQQLVGTFSNMPNPCDVEGTDKCVRHSITYTFNSASECFVATSFTALQKISAAWFGITQQTIVSGGNVKLYIPKAKSANGGTNAIDYRTIINHTNTFEQNILPTDWEDSNLPPDRYIQFNDNIGINVGYIFDIGIGGNNRKNALGNNANSLAINIASTKKMYPQAIFWQNMQAGSCYGGVAWRKYRDPSKLNKNGVIDTNVFEYGGKCYIYADFSATGIYEINIPSKYAGREVKVLEKRANVSLITNVASSSVLVKVDSDSVMYGYIVAEIAM